MTTVVRRDEGTGRNLGHDLGGTRYGLLLVLERTGEKTPGGYIIWRARCDCGSVVERPSYSFQRGCKSCGCLTETIGRPRIANSGAHVNHLFARYAKGARERGYSFELSQEVFREIIEKPCTYCGIEPIERRHKSIAGVYAYTGVDRVDNTRGYTLDNCVPCCGTCNQMKNSRPLDDFMAWAERVSRHLFAA